MKNKLWRMISEYKFTMIFLVLWTVFGIGEEILDEFLYSYSFDYMEEWRKAVRKWINWSLMEGISRCLLLCVSGLMLVEAGIKRNWKKKLPAGLSLIGLSALLAYFVTILEPNDRAQEWMTGYVILTLVCGIYFMFKSTGLKFSVYVGRVFVNFVVITFLSTLLWIGGILLAIVATDLLGGPDYIGTSLTTFLMVAFFIAGSIWALCDVEREMQPIFVFSVRYILPVIMLGMMASGYLYIVKMLLLCELPSNEVFSSMTILFVISLPVWIMNDALQKEGRYYKLLSALPWLYIPLLFLKTYSMGIRVWEYGLTKERYLGIMLIMFEMVTLVLWKFSKEQLQRLLLVIAAFTLLAVGVPGINMSSLPRNTQRAALEKYIERLKAGEMLSKEDARRMQGAYDYLQDELGTQQMIAQYGSLEEYENAGGLETAEEEIKEWHNIHGCQMVGELDMQGYRTMNMLKEAEEEMIYDDDNWRIVDFSHFKFVKRQSGEEVEMDLLPLYEQALAYEKEHPESSSSEDTAFLKKLNRIELADGNVFYVYHFEIGWYLMKENGEEVWKIRSTNISGMLLEK